MEIPSEPLEEVPVRARKRRWVLLILLLFTVGLMTVIWYLFYLPQRGVIRQAKERAATKLAVEIAGAVSSFYASYDQLPIDFPNADWVGTTEGKNGLIAILTGAEGPNEKLRNHKRINYLDGFKQARSDVSGKLVFGIDDQTDPLQPAIYDPWGQPFIVIMDTNLDSRIVDPLKSSIPFEVRGKKALVYSTGPPNADGTPNTDESEFLMSWR